MFVFHSLHLTSEVGAPQQAHSITLYNTMLIKVMAGRQTYS